MSNIETDVSGVFADDTIEYGSDSFPVFDVDYNTFATAKEDRRKIVAPEDSAVYQYTRNSQLNRPFYVRTEYNDQSLVRKVK
jgi:hypothetical protein